MIATLTGLISEHQGPRVIVETNGIGFGVLVTLTDLSRLSIGKRAKLYIYENIKEDAHDLIGFYEPATKQLFEQLLSVKNVGPKGALAVLDAGSLEGVRSAIAGGDVKFLQTAKGVGKRAAEQIVVELRDKVGIVTSDHAEQLVHRSGVNISDEAVQALMALGYSDIDAQSALASTDPNAPLEIRVKEALKHNP